MRRPPPYSVLSQDGRRAAYVYGSSLLWLDTASGQTHVVSLPSEASKVALSPDAIWVVLASHDTLRVGKLADTFKETAHTTLPAVPYRLITSNDGTTAASFVYNDEEGVIGVWKGEDLTPLLGRQGYSLGNVLPDLIRLEAASNLLLVWGMQGSGAFGGDGKPYVHLFDSSKGKPREVWDGHNLSLTPNGFVMPLGKNHLGVHDRNHFSVYDMNAPEDAPVTYAFEGMEKVVSSPDGKRIAWLWHTSHAKQTTSHLASIRLGEKAPDVISFDHMGTFEQFAVADDGQITLIYGQEPDTLLVFRADGDQLKQTADVNVRTALSL